jgi:hypothetical protein
MMGCRAITRRELSLGFGAIALLAIAVFWAPSGLTEAVVYLLPALLLVPVLLARRYPGERALLACIGQRRRRRTRSGVRVALPSPRPRAVVPRGGCLIASSLAVRPPPAVVSLH